MRASRRIHKGPYLSTVNASRLEQLGDRLPSANVPSLKPRCTRAVDVLLLPRLRLHVRRPSQ